MRLRSGGSRECNARASRRGPDAARSDREESGVKSGPCRAGHRPTLVPGGRQPIAAPSAEFEPARSRHAVLSKARRGRHGTMASGVTRTPRRHFCVAPRTVWSGARRAGCRARPPHPALRGGESRSRLRPHRRPQRRRRRARGYALEQLQWEREAMREMLGECGPLLVDIGRRR